MASAEDNLSRNDAAAAAGLYRLLARLWLREVDEPLLRSLTGSPLREPFLRAGGELPETVSPEVLQALSVDYCRLFLGPTDHLPPVQSVWQQGQFQGQAVRSMAGWIELTGYDTRLVPRGVMLDHLGVQCDVMRHILAGAVQAGAVQAGAVQEGAVQEGAVQTAAPGTGDTPTFQLLLEMAESYATRHLRWPFDMLRAAEERAQTPFYRSLSRLTCQFLLSETSVLLSEKLDGGPAAGQ